MGATNTQGVYIYDATDQVSPIHTFANLQASALTARIGSVFTSCTSTTRPSSPYPNQMIYETDTQTIRFRNASTSKWVSIPYRSGNTNQFAPNVTGGQTANVDLNNYALPSTPYPCSVNVSCAVQGTITSTGRARLYVGYDSGTPTANGTTAASSLFADFVQGNGTATSDSGMSGSYLSHNVAAGATPTYKSVLQIVAGTFNVSDAYGAAFTLQWFETSTSV